MFVAERLDTVGRRLEDVKLDLINAGHLPMLAVIDVAQRKLRTVTDKIRYADYGYAGLFDTDKVDETILDQMYEFDHGLVATVQEIETLAGALNADSPTIKNDISLMDDKIEALGAQFAEREHLITGAGR
jgi:hypothetical protein